MEAGLSSGLCLVHPMGTGARASSPVARTGTSSDANVSSPPPLSEQPSQDSIALQSDKRPPYRCPPTAGGKRQQCSVSNTEGRDTSSTRLPAGADNAEGAARSSAASTDSETPSETVAGSEDNNGNDCVDDVSERRTPHGEDAEGDRVEPGDAAAKPVRNDGDSVAGVAKEVGRLEASATGAESPRSGLEASKTTATETSVARPRASQHRPLDSPEAQARREGERPGALLRCEDSGESSVTESGTTLGIGDEAQQSNSLGSEDNSGVIPATTATAPVEKSNLELSPGGGAVEAVEALAAVPAAAKAAAAVAGGRPIIPGVPGTMMDKTERQTSECIVEIAIGNSGELVYSFNKSGSPRRGKWSRLEEEFAKR